MKFKIGQRVRSLANPNNIYEVLREVSRQRIEVKYIWPESCGEQIGPDDIYITRKNQVVAA